MNPMQTVPLLALLTALLSVACRSTASSSPAPAGEPFASVTLQFES
jgi:hypothetical protein